MLFRLREILLSKNISFTSFAVRMNMAPSSLAVTDKFSPSLATMQRYADELQIPIWELVYDCGVPISSPYVRTANEMAIEDKVVKRIQKLMAARNLNVRRLALSVGVTAQALGQMLKRRKMSLKSIESIAAGLSVMPWELLATPEEVRGEVLRRKAALGLLEEPDNKKVQAEPIRKNIEPRGSAIKLNDGLYEYGHITIRLCNGRVTVMQDQ